MANPELVELLKQGSKVWNRWYEQQPGVLTGDPLAEGSVMIDLIGADLSGANLIGTNLFAANLSRANLIGAKLINANLVVVNLGSADLRQVNLRGANLNYTSLSSANLDGANLSWANLYKANLGNVNLTSVNLSYTNLREAFLNDVNLNNARVEKTDLTDAIFGRTLLSNLDLRNVIGLETIQHQYPSTIGLDTIYRSRGQIPEVFLRGCGVPETFIINMRALVESISPIEFYSCFISYSHQNEDFAKRLHADLQAKGVRCWFAEEDLKIGDHYHQRIDEAIRLYDKLILVLSDAAVQSAWVEREVVAAREKEDRQQREVLFPLRLDDAVMETNQAWAADVRRRWHIGDFAKWKDHDSYQQAFERLLRDLKAQV